MWDWHNTDDLSSDFDLLKISVLLKSQLVQEKDKNLTRDAIRYSQSPTIRKSEERPRQPELSSPRFETSPANNANIIYRKTISEYKENKQNEVKDAIQKRAQEFKEFSRKQKEVQVRQWQQRQEKMISTMHQQENVILKALEQHDRDAQAKREILEKQNQQMAERRKKSDREFQETKKLAAQVIETVQKTQLEFKTVYANIVADIRVMDPNLKISLSKHTIMINQLREQMDGLVQKCKNFTWKCTLQDIKKCEEIIDLITKIARFIQEVSSKHQQAPQEVQSPVPERSISEVKPQQTFPKPQEVVSVPREEIKTVQVQTVVPSVQVTLPETVVAPANISGAPVEDNSGMDDRKFIGEMSLQIFTELENFLVQHERSLEPLLNDTSMKMFRSNCKKAVNTPINTLSDQHPLHLLDKHTKLSSLLSGATINIAGDHITASTHPLGLLYTAQLLARKFIQQGDLIVSGSSATGAAFNYATVMVSLANEFPVFGTLLRGYFYRECPYLVPWYPQEREGEGEAAWLQRCGYRVKEGVVEDRDKYLRRMTGIMRLYAAMLISRPKQSQRGANSHSLSAAWRWLTATLNLPPRAEITATMLGTFLEMAGHRMQHVYGVQFRRLMEFLITDYLPRVRECDQSAGGPVSRLVALLEGYVSAGGFEEPSGIMPENFW